MVQSAVVENDSDAFSVSLLAFWVKGSITLDDAFLRVNMPNTVWFLPVSKKIHLPFQELLTYTHRNHIS